MNKSLKKLNLSNNSLIILEKRYLKKGANGKIIETPEEMYARVAKVISYVEDKYKSGYSSTELFEKFYNMMVEFYFQPNSFLLD